METWEEEEAPTAGDIQEEDHSEEGPGAQDAAQEIQAGQQARDAAREIQVGQQVPDSEGRRREGLDLADPEEGGADRAITGPEDGAGLPRLSVDGDARGEADASAQQSY